MDAIVSFMLWLLVEVVLIGTGRAVVACISLGRWRGERPGQQEGRTFSAAGALSFKRDGQRVFTITGLLFVGLVFYVLCAGMSLWLSAQ